MGFDTPVTNNTQYEEISTDSGNGKWKLSKYSELMKLQKFMTDLYNITDSLVIDKRKNGHVKIMRKYYEYIDITLIKDLFQRKRKQDKFIIVSSKSLLRENTSSKLTEPVAKYKVAIVYMNLFFSTRFEKHYRVEKNVSLRATK